MVKIAVFFADGTEELEGITPVDLLKRCEGAFVETVSVCGKSITTSHGVVITPDKTVGEVDLLSYDALVIPGGMPGATNIAACKKVSEAIENAEKSGKLVAAICASPAVVLASQGFFRGKKLTCYPAPAFIKMLKNNDYTAAEVEVDKNLITANGPKSAFMFAKAICEYLELNPKF